MEHAKGMSIRKQGSCPADVDVDVDNPERLGAKHECKLNSGQTMYVVANQTQLAIIGAMHAECMIARHFCHTSKPVREERCTTILLCHARL